MAGHHFVNSFLHQTELWVRDPALDIHARLAGVTTRPFDFSPPQQEATHPDNHPSSSSPRSAHPPRSLASASVCSSMAQTLIHQAHDSAAYPPSLCSASCITSTTPTETSISTTLASHLDPSLPLLQDNNGVLEVPPQHRPLTPVYECAFWFLNCAYVSPCQSEWLTHVEAHFRGEEPPRTVQCPLCHWKYTHPSDGRLAWNARMLHIADGHTMLGHSLRTSRPDFDLFQHLWRKRLIDSEDLKELVGGNHNLERRLGNFTETGRNGRRREPRRSGGRQHVGAGRSIAA